MRRIYLHPLPLRIWHWTNAIGIVLLVLTGIQIRYVGIVDIVSFHTAVVLHSWIGWIVVANFFLWFLYYLFSIQGRVYHAELNPVELFRGSLRQLVYYSSGIFKGLRNPFHYGLFRKFNPLQALTYQVVMGVLVPIQIVTGILLWDLHRFAGIVNLLGGVRVIDTVHVLIFIVIVFYIPLHAYLAMLGHTTFEHYKAMLTGYEDIEDEKDAGPAE